MSLKSRLGRSVRRNLGMLLGGRLACINYRGFKFYVDLGDGVISWRLLLGFGFEEKSKDLILRLVREGDVIFDVGANIGDYTLPLSAAIGPKGAVWAFEPVRRSFVVLSKNIEKNRIQNVLAREIAVGDADGRCTIYCDASNFGGNSLMVDATTDKGAVLDVAITRLDTVCALGQIVPDLVKVDVQGAELGVLAGAAHLLGNDRTAFWLEYWPAGLAAFGGSVREFGDLAFRNGRAVYTIDGNRLTPIDQPSLEALAMPDGYADIFSVPSGWFERRNIVPG